MLILFFVFIFSTSFVFACNNEYICNEIETHASCPSDCEPAIPTNENVLCVYNLNDNISTEVCEYYLEKRPGASSLGVDFSDSNFTDVPKEASLAKNFKDFVVAPVLNWVNNSEKHITHIAIAKGLPIRVYDSERKSYSYGAKIYAANSYLMTPFSTDNHYLNDFRINFENTHTHFYPDDFKDNGQYTLRFAVTYLTGYNLVDIKKMIDKAQMPINDLSELKWVLDKDSDNWSIDKLNYFTSALINAGVNEENIIRNYDNSIPIITNKNVIGYYGPGKYHTGYGGGLWITKTGLFNFNVSNRAIMGSLESYNATTFTGDNTHPTEMKNSNHGKIADAITKESFGGNNYSNSFSGAGGHIEEPYHPGELNITYLFPAYASGLTLGEAYLAAHGTMWRHIMIGDPLMRINNSTNNKRKALAICENDLQCESNDCAETLRGESLSISNKHCKAHEENCLFAYGSISSATPREIRNGNSYCDGGDIYTCINGNWILNTNENKKCKTSYLNLESSIAFYDYNAELKLDTGEICKSNDECYGDICSEDINGIKRCHSTASSCIKGNVPGETDNGSTICINENEKIMCDNGEWKINEKILCEGGCINGKCEGEIFRDNKFYFLAGKKYTITIPSNIGITKISDLFVNPPIRTKVYTYNKGWNLNSFSTTRPCPTGCWSNPDQNIYPGEGIYVELNGDENYNLQITSNAFYDPVEIRIHGKSNLIGIPFNKTYTASKLINELKQIDSNCSKILMGGNGSGSSVFWEKSADKDFFIYPYLGYWVTCGEDSNFTWLPKNGFCKDNEEWRTGKCIRTDIHRIINSQKFDLKIDNELNPDKNFFEEKRVKIETEKHTIEFNHDFSKEDLNLIGINIDFNQEEKSIIVKGIGKTKDITLERTENETVCIADMELNSTEELIENCVEMSCPGTRNYLSCEVDGNEITIKGLKHSGIILLDPIPTYCGDGVCNIDENCYQCSNDCGACECFENDDCNLHSKTEKTCDGNNLVTKIYYPSCVIPIDSDPYCNYPFSQVTSSCELCSDNKCINNSSNINDDSEIITNPEENFYEPIEGEITDFNNDINNPAENNNAEFNISLYLYIGIILTIILFVLLIFTRKNPEDNVS